MKPCECINWAREASDSIETHHKECPAYQPKRQTVQPGEPREPEPDTRFREVYDLLMDGWELYKAARWVGLAPASAEGVYYKYVVWNRMVAAEKRIADLEAELNTLKGATS